MPFRLYLQDTDRICEASIDKKMEEYACVHDSRWNKGNKIGWLTKSLIHKSGDMDLCRMVILRENISVNN